MIIRKRTRFSEEVALYEYEGHTGEMSTSTCPLSTESIEASVNETNGDKLVQPSGASISCSFMEKSQHSSCKRRVAENICRSLFAVDDFRTKKKAKAYYFLTHGHSDHYGSLSSKWHRQIYCTRKTAALLPFLTSKKDGSGVLKELLQELDYGAPYELDGFQVTLFDANHCPGAAMMFFDGKHRVFDEGPILFSGDIRADRNLLARFETDPQYRVLIDNVLGHVFIDDTYIWDELTHFPPRDELFPRIFEAILWASCSTQLLIPLHKLGKEDALVKIASYTGEKIVLDAGRWLMREILFSPDELKHFVDPNDNSIEARIHVCLRFQAGNYYERFLEQGFECRVINLTMQQKTLSRRIPDECIDAFPYSDHSSFEEIYRLLSLLRIKHLHPWSGRNVSDDDRWKILVKACDPDRPKAFPVFELHQRLAKGLLETLSSLPTDPIPALKANGYMLNSLAPELKAAETRYKDEDFKIDWSKVTLK